MFRLIQVHHHILTVDQDNPPITLVRTRDLLTTVTRPPQPNKDSKTKAEETANRWLMDTLIWMDNHYKATAEELHARLKNMYSATRWGEAWKIAIKWANKNLKRLHPQAVRFAGTSLPFGEEESDETPTYIPLTNSPTKNTEPRNQAEVRQEHPQNPDGKGHTERLPDNTTQVQTGPRSLTEHLENEILPFLHYDDDFPKLPPPQVTTPTPPTQPLLRISGRTRPRRNQKMSLRPNSAEVPPGGNNTPSPWTLPPCSLPILQHSSELLPQPTRRISPRTGIVPQRVTPNAGKRTNQKRRSPENVLGDGKNGTLYKDYGNTMDKSGTWSLTPQRPILIIGDSNLRPLPPNAKEVGSLQVACYPGARFEHANHLLRKKTPTSNNVDKVILAFGINERQQRVSKKKKDLHAMMSAAAATFPSARIFIPLLNASESLPEAERKQVETINTLLQEQQHTIPPIPQELFKTTDGVHWTAPTRQRIWTHWLTFLEK